MSRRGEADDDDDDGVELIDDDEREWKPRGPSSGSIDQGIYRDKVQTVSTAVGSFAGNDRALADDGVPDDDEVDESTMVVL